MRWPFVTRSTMQEELRERENRIASLETELTEIKKERKVLFNEIVYRHSGRPIFPELVPARSAPPVKESEPADPMQAPIPTSTEAAARRTGSQHARTIINDLQRTVTEINHASGIKPVTSTRVGNGVASS